MRKWFLISATAASMAVATAVAPAFASDIAPTGNTTLTCKVNVFGRSVDYTAALDRPLPVIAQPITVQQNGVTVTVTPGGSATLQFGQFTASANCTAA